MILNQHLPTSKIFRHPSNYALGLICLLLAAAIHPTKADLSGVEACQNRCFNRSECDGVGNGLCCQWDDEVGQCISSIAHDICPGTATMTPLPPGPSIDCSLTAMNKLESAHRNLSNNQQAESAPSASPTSNCEKDAKTLLDGLLCIGFTKSQVTTLIINRKITAVLSILGSGYIVQDVLRDPKKRNESTYHRLMLGLSLSDIIFSIIYFLGTWIMPKGSHLFAAGSNATCSAGGFFSGIGAMATLLYSCSLATFYLLKLKYSWVNSKIKASEKWLLYLPGAASLIFGITTAAMSRLRPFGFGCA